MSLQPPAPFERILVSTDFSPMADHALARAARLPLASHAELTVAHVLPEDVPGKLLDSVEEFARQRLERARRGLVAQLVDSGLPGITVSSALLHGRASAEIVRRAGEEGAELVVLGRQGARALKALLIGSTAEEVFRTGGITTLIVARPPRVDYRRPLIGVSLDADGPELVERAARAFAPEARRARLLHAYRMPLQGLLPWAHASNVLMPLRKHARELAQAGVAQLESALAGLDVHWDATIVRGDPRHAIVAESLRRSSDLIVVGTHARSRLAHAWAGSVTEAVVRAATPDVLVVPLPDGPAVARPLGGDAP